MAELELEVTGGETDGLGIGVGLGVGLRVGEAGIDDSTCGDGWETAPCVASSLL